MRYAPAISIAFFLGVVLLAAGQVVPGYGASAFLNLLGGALLIVVAVRALAGWAGLHREVPPSLEGDETVLLQTEGVWVRTTTLLVGSRQGPYRARLTNRRLLLSLRVLRVATARDVTVAWLESGRPLSLLSIEVRPSGEIRLTPERRFGPRLRLQVPNPSEWVGALRASHPELLRQELSTST